MSARWGDEHPLRTDCWPCPGSASEDALITLSRCPIIATWGYRVEGASVWWTLLDDEDRDCKHLQIKRVVHRSISEHRPLDWPS